MFRNEQFRVAFEELALVLRKFAPYSSKHQSIYTTFVETAEIEFPDSITDQT